MKFATILLELFNHLLGHVKEYEPLFCTWLGSTPEVHIVKAEYLEIVMNNSVHITKGNQYEYLVPWLGQGLLTSKGDSIYINRLEL